METRYVMLFNKQQVYASSLKYNRSQVLSQQKNNINYIRNSPLK